MKKSIFTLIISSCIMIVNAQQSLKKETSSLIEKEKLIQLEKINFSDNKKRPINPYRGTYSPQLKNIHSPSAKTNSTSCNNIDFEDGNYNNWQTFKGYNNNSLTAPTNVVFDSTATITGVNVFNSWHSIINDTNATDLSGIAVNSNYIGRTIARVNHIGSGNQVGILERQILVSVNDPFVNFSYAAFLENAGHAASDQPYINIFFFDSNNDTIPGTFLNITANTSSANLGFSTITNYGGTQFFYKPWTPVSVDLTAYAGQTITAQFTAADCIQGGHGGYMYVDFDCNSSGTTVPNTWPGDANYDLSVNFEDLFYIGAAYNNTGIPRATLDNSYSAFPSTDWASHSMYLVDAKHADCNGDGTINGLDTVAIFQNYGLTHAFKNDVTHLIAQNTTNQQVISIIPNADSVYASQDFNLSFNIGDVSAPLDSIYGIGFTLNYPEQFIDALYTNQTSTGSVLGTYGTNLIKLAKPTTTNNLDLVVVKTDHQNSMNIYGNIFTLKLKANQQSLMNDSASYFTISNVKAITKSGYTIPFSSSTKQIKFKSNLATSITTTQLATASIYPNPAQNKIILSSSNKIKNYKITSILGSVIKQSTGNGNTSVDIDISELAKSAYFISIETENGNKIVKQFIKL